MFVPLDFGFLPGAIAGDGDPLDVLALQPHTDFLDCLVRAKLLGIIRGMQSKDGGKEVENDRLATTDFNFESWNSRADLPWASSFAVNQTMRAGARFHLTASIRRN